LQGQDVAVDGAPATAAKNMWKPCEVPVFPAFFMQQEIHGFGLLTHFGRYAYGGNNPWIIPATDKMENTGHVGSESRNGN